MFDYCVNSKKGIVINIGQFLSHSVNWLDSEGKLLSVDVINSWNRVQLAEQFATKNYNDPRYGDNATILENRDLFIKEVAIKIDELIPKRYFVKFHSMNNTYNTKDGTILQKRFKNKDSHKETRDLVYHYSCNNGKEPFVTYATKKQLDYLEYLAAESGYVLKNIDLLELNKARELIGFLLGNEETIEDMFDYLMYE